MEAEREDRRKKKHFIYANEKGKAVAQAFKLATWALSILPLSSPLTVYLSTPGSGIPTAWGYSMRGGGGKGVQRSGDAGETVRIQKIHQQGSWQWEVPPSLHQNLSFQLSANSLEQQEPMHTHTTAQSTWM